MNIVSNYHARRLLDWEDLTDKEKKELDWCSEDEHQANFFRFRGDVYSLDEFVSKYSIWTVKPWPFGKWEAYASQGFGFGFLVRYPVDEWGQPDTDYIVVGTYH